LTEPKKRKCIVRLGGQVSDITEKLRHFNLFDDSKTLDMYKKGFDNEQKSIWRDPRDCSHLLNANLIPAGPRPGLPL